jgi:murein L,D-transpeptidase YafK
MNKWVLPVLLSLFLYQQVSWADDAYKIVIKRSENKLLIEKNEKVIRSYHAAIGSGGRKAKQMEGDRRTPMGIYHIVDIKDSDRFHLFLQLDYPSVRDAINGLKAGHIFGGIPPQNTALGGVIGIHGIGVETKDKLEIHQMANWTQGCIALRNKEIDELLKFVGVGTEVKIME